LAITELPRPSKEETNAIYTFTSNRQPNEYASGARRSGRRYRHRLRQMGVPAGDSSPAVTVVSSDAAHGGWTEATAERKLAQMDAAEQHRRSVGAAENSQTDVSSGTTTTPVRLSPAERKLMDIY
jgi:hypothetical protein